MDASMLDGATGSHLENLQYRHALPSGLFAGVGLMLAVTLEGLEEPISEPRTSPAMPPMFDTAEAAPGPGPAPLDQQRSTPHVAKKGQPKNQGKGARCNAAYIEACRLGLTPPTLSELAERFGCSKATASRAIKPLEDQRKVFAREDRRDWEHESGRQHKGSVA